MKGFIKLSTQIINYFVFLITVISAANIDLTIKKSTMTLTAMLKNHTLTHHSLQPEHTLTERKPYNTDLEYILIIGVLSQVMSEYRLKLKKS